MNTALGVRESVESAVRRFRYRCFTFFYRFRGEAIPKGWIPNLFRGAFGATLRRITCFCPRSEAKPVAHRRGCVYREMFESPVSGLAAGAPSLTTYAPHPFAFFVERIPEDGRGRVEVVLFGSALKYFPYVLMTFTQMGQAGIGRCRSRFDIEEVTSEGVPVYDAKTEEILEYREPRVFAPSPAAPPEIGLRLRSPLWLIRGGRQVRRFAPAPFFASLVRRIDLLLACYCGQGAAWDKKELLDRLTASVRLAGGRTAYITKKRFSRRQQTDMEVGGLLGEVVLAGDLTEAMMLLELGEIIHNGKKTSFGNGKYELFSPGKTNDV